MEIINADVETSFECNAGLFLEGSNNANLAKALIRDARQQVSEMSDISGIGTVAKYLDNCDIEKLIEKIEQTKDSLLRFDSDFGEEYFKLLKDCIDKLDKDGNEEQYLTQYGIYEKDYWNALAAMLEKNEGILNDELKEQLAVARAMAGYYNTTDEIGSKDTSSERMVELLEERKKYEKQLLKLNKNYTDEELENAISELDNKYGRLVLGVKYNSVQERLTKLSVDDEGYKEKCLALLKEGNEYEKELLKGLPEDEYNKQLKLLENDYQKKILLVESSVIENEFSKLNVDDKDYSTKYLALLDRQKETAQSLLKLDGSLTSEELNTKLELIDSQYKYSRLITENNKIESDLNGLDIESDDYNEQVLSLLKQQRGCMEELLRMNNSLTEEQISAQLSLLDQNIYQAEQNVEWDKTNFVEKGIQYTGTFLASTVCGVVDVGESIYDGLAMIEGKLLNDEQTAADIVKTDVSEEFYSAWMKNLGVNDNAAYSKVHDVGNFVGNAAGYALLSAVPGGAAVTGTLGFLAASGSASERALNNGASYNQALSVGFIAGSAGYLGGSLTNQALSKMADKAYSAIWEVAVDSLKVGAIGAIESLYNSATEYGVYVKDLKDENGELLYDSALDYFVKSGSLTNVLTGFASGFLSAGVRGLKKYNSNVNTNSKIEINNEINNEKIEPKRYDKYWDFLDDYEDSTKALKSSLTADEQEIISNYVHADSNRSSYAAINSMLRDIAIDDENKTITIYHTFRGPRKFTFDEYYNFFGETVDQFIIRTYDEALKLDDVVCRTTFKEDTVVYRGVDMNALSRFGISVTDSADEIMGKLGSVYTDLGFMSCSPVSYGGFTHKDINFVMTCKKGFPFADFSFCNFCEQEILLSYGSRFDIDGVEKIGEKIMIYMTSRN